MQDLGIGKLLAPEAPAAPVPTVADALDLPVAPAPLKLRAFDDSAAAREAMQENLLKAVQGRYPIENQVHKLALENVGWSGADKFSLKEQKRAIMRGDSLDRRLEGDWVLYDKKTGNEMARRRAVVAHVPFLTNRGTFIYHGNEYTVGNQMRLKPGVYARVKENGILESHVNVRPGTGPSFRIYMEPDTGIFRMGLGQSELKLYPILKSLGVTDEEMVKAWGRDLVQRNIEAEDPRAVSRAFHKLVGSLEDEPPENLDVEAEKEAADTQEGTRRSAADQRGLQKDSDEGRGRAEDLRHGSRSDDSAQHGEGIAVRESGEGGAEEGRPQAGVLPVKEAASIEGVQTAAKWIAPIFGGALVPAGLGVSSYGYGLAGVAGKVREDIRAAKKIKRDYARRFGPEVIGSWKGEKVGPAYDLFDPAGETYKHWRHLRRSKFLEPYIRAGHEGLITPISRKSEAVDVIRNLRQLVGAWTPSAREHYAAFVDSPRAALEQLAREGIDFTGAKGMNTAVKEVLNDYDLLASKHGPYEGLRKLYNQPWASVNLSNPKSIAKYIDQFGEEEFKKVKNKQAALFYASRAMMFAPKYYGGVVTASGALGHTLGLGGAAAAGYGGYKALMGLARLLKRGEAAEAVKLPETVSKEDVKEIVKAQEGNVVTDVLAGANPFSTKVDVMGVPFKPESRKEELKRVIPAVIGKGLVGAIVVPSMVRSGVELSRGLALQGPYATLGRGRIHAGLAGALLGSIIPIKTLARAFHVGHVLKGIEKGKVVTPDKLKMLAKQLGEAPLRSSRATMRAIPELEAGRTIAPDLAREARKELFEPNTTIILNALLGGGITGYAGYAAYKRGKQLREAFEKVYGKELPPEVAAVIMNPQKLKELAKMRREELMAERRSNWMDKVEESRRARLKAKQEHKGE